ncbi:GyrI-like domain-containing protein [Nonomuraea sp. NPDC059194]|uniref:GyrI-like domain-containing protein n=1 Tax=Nonomuraea sp. NPDC059194 TaxID=3346764 RepID=UPI00367F01E7
MKTIHRDLFAAKAAACLIEAPALPYLMADGVGDPSGETYRDTVAALYGVAYAVRKELKPSLTYSVAPLEGLWDGSPDDRASLRWTAMILQPVQATAQMVAAACAAKGVTGVRLDTLAEGRCAQILHVGPYRDEPATVEKLMAFVAERGLVVSGRHHEIYLSVPGRTPEEKMKTLIRYPVSEQGR